MIKIRKLVHVNPETSRLESAGYSFEPGNELVIRSLASLVSLGTERLVARGKVPGESYAAMKVPGMEGSFSFPCTYGYSLVGKVIEGPPQLKEQRVHLMHPHADRVIAEQSAISAVPERIPDHRATLASNMETVLNALWDSRMSGGEKVLVVGYGLIGALIASLVKAKEPKELFICDPDPAKKSLAANLGFNHQTPGQVLKDHYDIVFHCSASGAGLQTAIDSAGFEGKVIETSWYGTREVCLKLGGSFHYMRKMIISSQVSSIPGHMKEDWDFDKRKKYIWQVLRDPWYDQLITRTIPFEDAPDFFNDLRKGIISEPGVVIEY